MLIFRVFTDAGCGGIRYPEVSDYRPQPLGYSYASLSRASHDWRGGGGGSLPALYETVLRTVSHAFCY